MRAFGVALSLVTVVAVQAQDHPERATWTARDYVKNREATFSGCSNIHASETKLVQFADRREELCAAKGAHGIDKGGLWCSFDEENGAKEAFCKAERLRVDGPAALSWVRGGGAVKDRKSLPELELNRAAGMSSLPCQVDHNALSRRTGHGGQEWLSKSLASQPETRCDGHIKRPVYMLADKYGGVNPWHAIEGMAHAFAVYALYELRSEDAQVILMDVPAAASVDADPQLAGKHAQDLLTSYMATWKPIWRTSFSGGGPVISFAQLMMNATLLAKSMDMESAGPELKAVLEQPGDAAVRSAALVALWEKPGSSLCFDTATFGIHGGVSPFSSGRQACPGAPMMMGMSDMFMDKIGLAHVLPTARKSGSERLNVVYALRGTGPNTASAGTPGRDIKDVNDLLKQLKRIPNIELSAYDFGRIPFATQARLTRTADVLVGVHGAALTWALFLPDTSALVEIELGFRCKCFTNLATWTQVTYRKAKSSSQAYGTSYANIVRTVSEAVTEVRRNIAAKRASEDDNHDHDHAGGRA